MENTSVVAGKKASHLKCKSPKSSSNHCLNFLHKHFILEFLWKLYMKTLEFLSSCLGIKLTDVHFGGWMRSLFVCNNPLSPQLTTPILIYWHRGMNRKLLCAREVGSWELKERKEYFLLVERRFWCSLGHSRLLYIWAFNLRAWTFYQTYNTYMAPCWTPHGTVVTSFGSRCWATLWRSLWNV